MIKHLNRLLVAAFYGALFVPLVYLVGFAGIPTWGIPAAGLLTTAFISHVIRNAGVVAQPDIHEIAIVVFITMIWVSSLLFPPPTQYGFNKLFVFCLALIFSIYVKRYWGTTFNLQGLVGFACLMIVVQFVVGILQFVTQSTIGNPGAHLGISREAALGGGGGLGIGRVTGSVGSSPNILAQIIVVLIPFVAISDRVLAGRTGSSTFIFVGKGLLMGMAVVLVTLTASRSSIGVLALMMLITGSALAWQRIRQIRGRLTLTWRRLWGGYVLLIICGVTLFWLGRNPRAVQTLRVGAELVQYRIDQIGESDYGTLDLRYQLGKGALQMFANGPIVLGRGYLNTKNISSATDVYIPGDRNPRVHNAYLQFLAEGGIFAFLAILALTLYPIWLHLRVEHRNAANFAFLASLFAMLAFMQTATTYDAPATAPVYALVWGGAVAFAKAQRINRPSKEITSVKT